MFLEHESEAVAKLSNLGLSTMEKQNATATGMESKNYLALNLGLEPGKLYLSMGNNVHTIPTDRIKRRN